MTTTRERSRRNGHSQHQDYVRRAGLVVRVSTDRQAMNDEGSLKNQVQRLRQHMEYKRMAGGEDWVEVTVYELKAVSGKNSLRSPELLRLFDDIRSGRVNTVLCTALDRVSRSVKDFLNFFELLNEYQVEFVCLKQNYDTTTPQGKLFITIMMALAEFEREQTADRTRDATAARADRGLWNGGQLLGYDPDDKRKGYLIPNPKEALIVNFAFDAYLECGSITETVEALNRHGYRTKSYSSRRGRHHPGAEFRITLVQYMLKNWSYTGKKEINKGSRNDYRLVDAVWPGIVDPDKFQKVQQLMAANSHSNHNGAKTVGHVYALSGLLRCGRCGSVMLNRSGTGRLKVTYYYYICPKKDCGLRVAADEIEGIVLGRIGEIAGDEELSNRLVEETNHRMADQLPDLMARRKDLEQSLQELTNQAEKIMTQTISMAEEEGGAFLKDKLREMAQRKSDLEYGIGEVDAAIMRVKDGQVSAGAVHLALRKMDELYANLTPFEQRELMRLVLRQAEVNEDRILLELYPLAEDHVAQVPEMAAAQSRLRFEPPSWLPDEDSNLEPSG